MTSVWHMWPLMTLNNDGLKAQLISCFPETLTDLKWHQPAASIAISSMTVENFIHCVHVAAPRVSCFHLCPFSRPSLEVSLS